MSLEIKAPVFPESIADGQVATWRKKVGEFVMRDEVIAEIETDKVILEVPAPQDGYISKILKVRGDTVLSNELMAEFEAGKPDAAPTAATTESAPAPVLSTPPSAPAAVSSAAPSTPTLTNVMTTEVKDGPAARKAIAELEVNPATIQPTGPHDRITKADVVAAHQQQTQVQPAVSITTAATITPPSAQPAAPVVASAPTAATPAPIAKTESTAHQAISTAIGERVEKRVPMTRLRAKIAERLLHASQSTAMLTTFNEVNMKPIMDMRRSYGERFEKRHGVRLGFMSFFVKAATEALKRFPQVNASIDGNDIVYHGYYDVGVAVSSDRGLVVPILRSTDLMDFAEIEKNIGDYGVKAKEGKLSIDDMTGGTFTISNGGVFGSLLSTPILNTPQTAILGMHKIQERPMAVKGQVEILPMMYLALSYDHRLIDGKEAVQFLVTIKELVEDPAMLLLDL